MAYPTIVQDLLDEGRISIRGLMKFQFGTGTYGFAKSDQPIEWNGLTYQPGGVIKVSDLPGGMGTTARQFTIELAESPDDGLTPDVLKTIEAEDYRDRPVTIYDAFFHPDTGALLHVEALRRGYIDQLSHEEDPEEGYKLIADCETRALDYTRTNGRKRNMADQYRRVEGDNFYVNAATTGREEIFWGRARKSAKRAAIKLDGELGRMVDEFFGRFR